MKVTRTNRDLRNELGPHHTAGRTIGFVPTMGALHEGHLSLLQAARTSSDIVVMSIFVNPRQFGPHEDLAGYPRDEAADLEVAEGAGVDIAFCPPAREMYPPGASSSVAVGPLGDVLEGEARPGHFTGVATVVAKLLNVVQPRAAYFGQKDAQQVAVVRRMVTDLSFDVDIVVCPTVRAPDGLALSSRNRYLLPEERARATVLSRTLEAGRHAWGTSRSLEVVEKRMWEALISQEGVEPGYAAAVDPATFARPRLDGPVLLVVAAQVGRTRLIDNILLEPRGRQE
ncbi:MAG: pantoate--beta-alanine ligase [Actinomycetota bacterium]|nr:pantoate--beta-alanine ligase [Actinomycetota bacterium]